MFRAKCVRPGTQAFLLCAQRSYTPLFSGNVGGVKSIVQRVRNPLGAQATGPCSCSIRDVSTALDMTKGAIPVIEKQLIAAAGPSLQ